MLRNTTAAHHKQQCRVLQRTVNTLITFVEKLTAYVRPAGRHQMNLIDDLSAGSIERMKTSGFQPAAVVETSPGNFQAWLNHGLSLSKDSAPWLPDRLRRNLTAT